MKTIILLFITSVLLLGCQGQTEQKTEAKKTKAQDSLALKVALLPTLDCLPFFVAQDLGLYDSLKLDVRLVVKDSQMDCEEAYLEKKVDGFCTDLMRASLLQNNKKEIRVLSSLNSEYQLVSSKMLRIKKLSQLKDRMIVIARHSVTDFLSDEIVTSIKMKKDAIYRPQINSVSIRMNMLNNNQIDAAILPQPQAQLAIMQGGRLLYKSKKDQTNFSAIAFSCKAITNSYRKTQIKSLLEGYNLAVHRINKNKNLCDSILLKRYQIQPQDIKKIVLPLYKTAFRPSPSQIEKSVKWLRSRNKIRRDYSGDTLFLSEFVTPKGRNVLNN
ncbi:MAG: ABC transporter substrate-binding protein [Bacteroidaceae bacterium]